MERFEEAWIIARHLFLSEHIVWLDFDCCNPGGFRSILFILLRGMIGVVEVED